MPSLVRANASERAISPFIAGTGKTATVREVIRQLNMMVDDGDLPKFDFFEINGMRLTEPNQAYVQIW